MKKSSIQKVYGKKCDLQNIVQGSCKKCMKKLWKAYDSSLMKASNTHAVIILIFHLLKIFILHYWYITLHYRFLMWPQ